MNSNRRSEALRLLVVTAAGVAVLGACDQSAPPAPEASPPATSLVVPVPAPTAAAPGAMSPTATASPDPRDTAARWLRIYRAQDWQDDTVAWIERVRPLVTETQHARYQELRDGPTGADQADFVARKCRSAADDVEAVIPPEAPRTDSVTYVHVAATITTTCTTGTPVRRSEPTAITLALALGSDDLYRVDERLF